MSNYQMQNASDTPKLQMTLILVQLCLKTYMYTLSVKIVTISYKIIY
jgi:hypothetical protein